MGKHDDEGEELDLTLAGSWRKDDEPPLERWTLRTGGSRYEVWTDRATADALFALLRALPATVERLERERDRLHLEVERLSTERDKLASGRHGTEGSSTPPARPPRGSEASLSEVPLAMIGTFRTDDPRVKAAAKKEPLMALAVQVAKALGPDASELDMARLRAMATAVSRGDLETFWAASAERSRKKLAGA